MDALAGPMLMVSPHLDDAILSCSALIEREEPLDVLTVFAGAPEPPLRGEWDEACGFASSAESIPARREEDRAAFAGTPHRLSYLDLLEGQYVEGPRAPTEAETIRSAVEAWLGRQRGTVALPVGAGGRGGRLGKLLVRTGRSSGHTPHPDHVFVRDALLATPAPLLFYEEFPYLLGGRVRPPVRAERLTVPVDRAQKARRIQAYASQLAHFPLDSLPPEERYWRLGSAASASAAARNRSRN